MKFRLLFLLLVLASCDSPPCKDEESAKKAAEVYRQCISTYHQGEGGYDCGRIAFKAFCRKE